MSDDEYEKALDETKKLDQFQTVVDESEAWYDRNRTTIVNRSFIFLRLWY